MSCRFEDGNNRTSAPQPSNVVSVFTEVPPIVSICGESNDFFDEDLFYFIDELPPQRNFCGFVVSLASIQ